MVTIVGVYNVTMATVLDILLTMATVSDTLVTMATVSDILVAIVTRYKQCRPTYDLHHLSTASHGLLCSC